MKEILLDLNDKVINGEMSALKAYIICKDLEKTLKDVLKGLSEEAITEAEKYGKGEHDAFGAKFQVRNGATRWDFKHISEWKNKSADLKAYEESLKALAKSGHTGIDEATGEVLELPKQIFGATTLSIKI
jgi:hypothetical protein